MKKTFILITAVAVMLSACQKNGNNGKPAGSSDASDNPSVIDPAGDGDATLEIVWPDDLEEIELDFNNKNKTVEFEWESDSEDAQWTIKFSLNQDMSSPQVIETQKDMKRKVTHEELDGILASLGIPAYEEGNVFWTVEGSLDGIIIQAEEVRSMKLIRFFAPFVDPRDNESYRVCRVVSPLTGEYQVWLADNLRAKKYSDGTEPEGELSVQFWTPTEVYDETWIPVFGGYYSWKAAVRNIEDAVDGKTVQGICPDGWHIPTKSDFVFLINNCTSQDTPGTDLKDKSLWADGAIGVNSIGFNMAGTGYIWEGNADVLEAGTFTAFWMSTVPVDGDSIPWNPPVSEFPHQAYSYSFTSSDYGAALYVYDRDRNYSIRCVKD